MLFEANISSIDGNVILIAIIAQSNAASEWFYNSEQYNCGSDRSRKRLQALPVVVQDCT